MPKKLKKPQEENVEVSQKGDSLYTPNYCTDIIAPYIPGVNIWETSAGDGMIVDRLMKRWNMNVYATEINGNYKYHNFLLDNIPSDLPNNVVLVSNPPFSLKKKWIEKCIQYDFPFAMLLPLDYSSWICEYIEKYNLQKVIPNRRVAYITPRVVERVNDKFGTSFTNYRSIPSKMIHSVSSSQFHSGWYTRYFGLGKSETFVELSTDQIQNNIV